MAVLEVNGLKKVYTTRFGGSRVQALTNVTFAVERGEYVAIMGESGSGKTTLLNILAALDRPTEGEVFLNGRALSTIGEKEIASFRRQNLGFVFQDFNLLDTFTLQDNIFLPLVLAGKHFPDAGEASAARAATRHCKSAPEVPVRGFRRPEAARRSGACAHHLTTDSPCG